MNRKYILILVILVVIGGGILIWYYLSETQCEVGKKYKTEECKCPKGTVSHPLYDEEKQEWFNICKPASEMPLS